MHFVTGGAYNGKATWVKNYYAFNECEKSRWISGYESIETPYSLPGDQDIVVLEGLEQWIFQWCDEHGTLDEIRQYGKEKISAWKAWEDQSPSRHLIIIGNDISKGIVPNDAKMRVWRDVTGWLYQDLTQLSDRVDVIWYGISVPLKTMDG